MLGVRQHIDNATGGHPLTQEAIDESEAFRLRLFLEPTQDRFALVEGQGCIGRKGRVRRADRLDELCLEVLDKSGRVCSNADLLTVGPDLLGIRLPADQLCAIVAELLTTSHTEIPGFALDHHTGEYTEFQRAVVDRLRGALMTLLPGHRLPPPLQAPRQCQLRCGGVVLPTDRQPCCPRPAMVFHKGDGLLEGRIGTGGSRM